MRWASGNGVSPSRVRQGQQGRASARSCGVGHGMAWNQLQTAALGASAPSAALFGSRFGAARHGEAKPGETQRGWVWCGKAWQQLISALSPTGLSAGFLGIQIWRGGARSGRLRQAVVRLGTASQQLISARRVGRLSLLGSLNPDMAMPEMARLGRAMKGLASSGEAGAAMGSREGGATRLFPVRATSLA